MTTDNNIEFNGNSTKFYGIEHIDGSDEDDYIRADGKNNTITGKAGNDYIQGLGGDDNIDAGAGNDIVEGGTGNDILEGGAGIDTLVYTNSLSGVTVNLENSISTGTDIGNDTISGFENIVGSSSEDNLTGDNDASVGNIIYGQGGNDSIYGLAGNDSLHGGAGNDYIDGGTGIDNLFGDSGNDLFKASSGGDIIDGGINIDTVDYRSSSIGITVTLANDGNSTNVDHNINGLFTDNLTNVEGIIGSLTASNDLTGNNMNNILTGGNLADIIKGVSGNNILSSGAGDDTIYSGLGDDTIDGGSHNSGDWLDYTATSNDITVSLHNKTATGSGNDTIENIEHLQMGTGSDTVEGDIYNNTLKGGDGAGIDTLSFANASNDITINLSDNNGTSTGFGTDTFVGFEKFLGSAQNDTLKTNATDNITFNGSQGIDTADYTGMGAAATVTVNSGNTSATVASGGNTDTLEEVENIISGEGNDTFVVSDVTNIDTLDGGGGNNTLQLSGDQLDLSSVTLLNFDTIIVANNDSLTLNAKDLSDKNIDITLNGTGNLIIVSDESSHDFTNINVSKGTGTVTLDVNIDKDISGVNINTFIDTFDVESGNVLTLNYSQFDGQNGIGTGTLKLNDTSLTGTQIKSVNDASTNAIDLSNVTSISTATMSEMLEIVENTNATFTTAANYTVTISDTSSAIDVSKVLGDTSGVVTATVTADTATNLNNNLTNSAANDALTLVVTGASAVASDLKALDGKTSVLVDANTNVDTITGTAADVKTVVESSGINTASDVSINIDSGTTTVAQEIAIDAQTTGVITANISNGAMSDLANLTNSNGNNALSITVTDSTALASELITLDTKTSVNIETALALNEIVGTKADITTVINSTTVVTATDINAKVSDPMTALELVSMDDITTGIITADISDGSMSALANLTNDNGNNSLNITVTDTSAVASELITLDTKTSKAIDTDTNVNTITGTATDIKTVVEASGIDTAVDVDVTVTVGEATVSEQIAIDSQTTGTITATITQGDVNTLKTLTSSGGVHALTIILADISATAGDLNIIDSKTSINVDASSIANITSSLISDVKTLITNKTSAGIDGDWNVVISNTLSAADAKIVNTATSGNIDIQASTTLDGTTADVLAIVNDASFTTNTNYATTLSDTASATDVNTIANDTAGVVTAVVTSGTASALNAALLNANTADKLTLTLTDGTLASVDNLLALSSKTSETINANSITSLTDSYSDLNALYSSSVIVGLGNEAVIISDTQSAANVNTILGKTSGDVTATVTAGTASSLNTALNNASASDKLNLTTTGTTASASDLLNLDGKTSITVDATSITNITGTGAELAAIAAADINTNANYTATLSGTSDISDINIVSADTSGAITATAAANDAATLNSTLTSKSIDEISLTVNGATATATDLNSLDAKTANDITVNATKVTGDFTDLETLYVTNKDNFAGLGNEEVTINDDTSSVNVNTIANATNQKVTATVSESDLATNLDLELSNTDINDDITIDYSNAGTLDFNNVDNSASIKDINFANGTNEVEFDSANQFNNMTMNLTDSDGVDDTISFTNEFTNQTDLDFSKVNGFENLNLSNGNDKLNITSDEPANINGEDGNDEFTLDFTNIDTKIINGGNDTTGDKVNLTGTSNAITADEEFGHINSFDNIESLDFTNFDLNASSGAEFELTGELIGAWTDGSNKLSLILDSDDASKLKFTDSNGTTGTGDDTLYGDSGSAITSGSYTLDDNGTQVTLDIIIQP